LLIDISGMQDNVLRSS